MQSDSNGMLRPESMAPAPTIAKLVIEMEIKTGSVTVTGPVADRRVCYAMLELARDAIQDMNRSNNTTKKSLVDVIPAVLQFGLD